MDNSPFKSTEPTIPGVLPKKEPSTSEPPPMREQSTSKFSTPQMPPLWMILSATSVMALCLFAVWWMRGTPAKENAAKIEAPAPVSAPDQPAPPAEKLPVGPGEIATTSELAKEWSAKKFIFRDPLTSREVPAMVVHLPGGAFWGFSLIEPYGSCEMELITDIQKIRVEYGYRASHPMVGDPCNRAVFDLTLYGSGPAGLVRGEIAQGAAVRPPLAIEVQVQGKEILAKKME